MIKLKKFAEKYGVCHKTAYNWFHEGLIPGAIQVATGAILVPNDAEVIEKEKKDVNNL